MSRRPGPTRGGGCGTVKQPTTSHLGTALALAALAVGWTIITASAGVSALVKGTTYLLALGIISLDLIDYLVRLYVVRIGAAAGDGPSGATGPLTPVQKRLHVRPFALVVSVYNGERSLQPFLREMEPYRDRLWIIDDGSTDSTVPMLQRSGYRCVPGGRNRKKPGAIRRLLAALPPDFETIVVLDPDIRPIGWTGNGEGALESVIFDLQRSGAAGVTPLISVGQSGVLTTFQRLEYFMALEVGRRSLGDAAVSSGIAVYQREPLERALEQHSLSVYAEDLELSLLLLGAGERLSYDGRLEVETDGEETLAGLFSQRVGWAYGLIRAYALRFSEVCKAASRGPYAAYQFLGYFGLVSILLQPLRLAATVGVGLSLLNGVAQLVSYDGLPELMRVPPSLFVVIYVHYLLLTILVLTTAVPRGSRLELVGAVPLYMFYALGLAIPTAVGYLNWLCLRTIGVRLFKDHYQDEGSLRSEVRGALIEEEG